MLNNTELHTEEWVKMLNLMLCVLLPKLKPKQNSAILKTEVSCSVFYEF